MRSRGLQAPKAEIDAASDALWNAGVRVMQGCRLARDEAGHVGELLRLMRPPQGARVIDLGCGFGEVVRLMREARPDLAFCLVNCNSGQLARCPEGPGLAPMLADLHALPIKDRAADGAMLLYSLCHADLADALAEAGRVVRRGGFLFVYDYERVEDDGGEAARVLYARFHSRTDLMRAALAAGWRVQWMARPAGDDAIFRALLGKDLHARMFASLRPIAWRALRL